MVEVDRMVAVIKPKEPFLDWVNQHLEPTQGPISLDDLQQDCTVLLIPPFEDLIEAEAFIEEIYADIFETELETWELDQSAWPGHRTFESFRKWFDIELHSLVFDIAYTDEEESEWGAGSATLQ